MYGPSVVAADWLLRNNRNHCTGRDQSEDSLVQTGDFARVYFFSGSFCLYLFLRASQ